MKKQIERKSWALLVIALAKGVGVTPVQLQKTLFLLGQKYLNVVGSDYYNFKPYDYGPFSVDVYCDLEELQKDGLIIAYPSPSGRWNMYGVTKKGQISAEEIEKELDSDAISFIREKINHFQTITFKEILKEVYIEFPKYAEKSVFQNT